jgi:hypothetical protein
MRYKQIYSFLIISTLLVLFSIDLIGQSRCDTSSHTIFVFTEVPPKMDKSIEELEIIVNRELNLALFKLEEKDLACSFIINCKGEDFDYKIFKSNNDGFNKVLVECLMRNINCTPAEQGGKKVDFKFVFNIRIDKNKINILAKSYHY